MFLYINFQINGFFFFLVLSILDNLNIIVLKNNQLKSKNKV